MKQLKIPPGVKYEILICTPETAKSWLSHNKKNRRVRDSRVEFYARQMEAGQWTLSGQPIIFDSNGRLCSGQHRLLACIKANVPFPTAVVRGIEPEAAKHIDLHAPWRFADILDSQGFSYSTMRAAAARVYLLLEQQKQGDSIHRWVSGGSDRSVIVQPSISEVTDTLRKNSDSVEKMIAIVGGKTAKKIMRPTGHFGGLFIYLHRRNAKRCEEFFTALAEGAELSRTSPIFRLRNSLIDNAQMSITKGRRRGAWAVGITIKAWNAWMLGETVKVLRIADTEAWPKIEIRKGGD